MSGYDSKADEFEDSFVDFIKKKCPKNKRDHDNISITSRKSNISLFSIKDGFKRRCSFNKLPNINNLLHQPIVQEKLRRMSTSIQRNCSFKNLHSIITHNKENSKNCCTENNTSDTFGEIPSVENQVIVPSINIESYNSNNTSLLSNALISSPFRKKCQTLTAYDRDQYYRKQYVLTHKNEAGLNRSHSNNSPNNKAITPKSKHFKIGKSWVESLPSKSLYSNLTSMEIKRQEAIHEFYYGEKDTLMDLECLRKVYLDSLKLLNLIKSEEIELSLSALQKIIPCHREMIAQMEKQRHCDTYITNEIGTTILNLVSNLSNHVDYCEHLTNLRRLLEEKYEKEERIKDFLDRCQNSPFSRRLDIWTFIDIPRIRIIKYPLLIKAILKTTPKDHLDYDSLSQAVKTIESVVSTIDTRVGLVKCKITIDKLEYVHDYQKLPDFQQSQQLICSGVLKNAKGMKLQTFLFDNLLVFTRPSSFNAKESSAKYTVYKRPIPLNQLHLIEPNTVNEELIISSNNSSSIGNSISSTLSSIVSRKDSFKTGTTQDKNVSTPNSANGNPETLNELKVSPIIETDDALKNDNETKNNTKGIEESSTNTNLPATFNNPHHSKHFAFGVQLQKRDYNPNDATMLHSITILEEHTLICKDFHDRKMWIDNIKQQCEKFVTTQAKNVLLKENETPDYNGNSLVAVTITEC